ncbi:MAG TPA: SUMF1/EgtB/PvdO family nonheme iron enzyme [Pirellulales bacterium]|nr:SUMF1/EgtB/PvdO family nonheme iron enzyme [Pirellulales bacterium]
MEAAAAALRKEPGARTTEIRTSIANRGLELADSAAAAGRFDLAESALKTAGVAASKLRRGSGELAELRKELAAKRKELDKAKRLREHEQAAYDDAVKTLETKPDDPAANEAVGKHLAFDRRDWAQGLKYLAKAGDGDLRNAARADRAGADSSARMTALGDLWWTLGEAAESPRDRLGYKSRAVFWYTRAANGLSGFARTRLEKRIKEAGDEALASAAEQTGGDNGQGTGGKFIDITLAPGVLMRLVKIPASKDGKVKSFYLGQTEVTQKQWVAVMGSNPSAQKGDNLPVTDVTLEECIRFASQCGRNLERFAVRLPTADEWKHAFGTGVDYGPDFATSSWCAETAKDMTHAVAQLRPNHFDLHDMLGNVWERVSGTGGPALGSGFDIKPVAAELRSGPLSATVGESNRLKNVGLRLMAEIN